MKTGLLAILVCMISTMSNAQNGKIRGTAWSNTDSSSVNGATITLLLAKDSSLLKSTITDGSGRFQLADLDQGNFILKISSIGYEDHVALVTLSGDSKDLGKIGLYKRGKELSSVTIIAKTPAAVQKGDTSQFNASQYKVNPDATTEDLIKKMPGITVDRNGTVTAQGEQVKKVTIDGKDFFGDDASAALKNLPSEVVDKIQVFDRLSDQAQLTGFDDGNSVKAINIVTKSGIKNGQFGRAFAGYGTDDRYNAGGNISFFKGERRLSFVASFNNINQQNFASQDLLGLTTSGNNNRNGSGNRGGGGGYMGGGGNNFSVGQSNGISATNAFGVNYSDKWGKKITISGSYFFNNSTNNNDYTTNTETLGEEKQFSVQSGLSHTTNYNNRLNLRLEYKIDSFNSIFIIPNINFQNNKSRSFSTLKTVNENQDSVNNSLADSKLDKNGYNIRNNILYRHSFAKKGRTVSFGFNTSFVKNDGENITKAGYRFYDSQGLFTSDSLQNQFSDNPTDGVTYSGSIAYTEPIGKKGQIQIEYNPSIQKNATNQETYLFDGQKYSKFDTTLSNKFDNTVTTNNAGITYRLTRSKDDMLSFGISYQNTKLESKRVFPVAASLDQTFSNFIPSAMWRKKLSAKSNVRIYYRASTNYPSINQLQDVVNLTNPLRVSIGNPALKQSFTHFISGRYTYNNSKTSQSFFANIFMQTTADYISNGIWITKNDSTIQNGIVLNKGSQLTKPVNVAGYRNIRTFFTYSMPVKSLKTTINLNAGYGYTRLPGVSNYTSTITDNVSYNGGVVFASNISEYIDFNISYNGSVNNAHTRGQSTADNKYVNHIFGAALNLLNKKGWFIQNDLSAQVYQGLSGSLDQHFILWNASIGKKFMKQKAAELKLSVFDMLGQNQSITRTVTESYIQDNQSEVLQRYFMLTFTYNLKNFGTPKKQGYGGNQEWIPGTRPGGPQY